MSLIPNGDPSDFDGSTAQLSQEYRVLSAESDGGLFVSVMGVLPFTLIYWRLRYMHHGLNALSSNPFTTLKCFTLLETSIILFSIAVAAIIASPALMFDERACSSTYISAGGLYSRSKVKLKTQIHL